MSKSRVWMIFLILTLWVSLSGFGPLPSGTFSSAQPAPLAAIDQIDKLFPPQDMSINGYKDQPTSNTLLAWTTLWDADGAEDLIYQVCINTSNTGACAGDWVTTDNAGKDTFYYAEEYFTGGLTANTAYYWQVRAIPVGGTASDATESVGGYWKFTTGDTRAFGKIAPRYNTAGQPVNGLALSWGSSVASGGGSPLSYQYCVSTTNLSCPTNGWKTPANALDTSAVVNGLLPDTVYYWQVRAHYSATSDIYANGNNAWFSFKTEAKPGDFAKLTPSLVDPADQPKDGVTLTWESASGNGVTYQYCYNTSAACPAGGWTDSPSSGTALTAELSGLAYQTLYYWQVRAVNNGGYTEANTGTWWTFTTVAAPPAPFSKTAPGDTDTHISLSPTLTWETNTSANVAYQYCLNTAPTCPVGGWKDSDGSGAQPSASLSGLDNFTVYYWQVHATNPTGESFGNDGTWYSFKTIPAAPPTFSKTSPNGATNQDLSLTLTWQANTGDEISYQYCVSETGASCPQDGWKDVSPSGATSMDISVTKYNQVYYWQVQAVNTTGTTQANGGWYTFKTKIAPPGGFHKTDPGNGDELLPRSPLLKWDASTDASTYQYCINSTATCPVGGWKDADSAGAALTAQLSGLDYETLYYWQVRAVNTTDTTEADSGTWHSFKTLLAPPQSFNKTSPGVDAKDQPQSLTLTWGQALGTGVTYQYCLNSSAACPANGWHDSDNSGKDLTAALTGLDPHATYYWQVKASNSTATTYADGETAWRAFTTLNHLPEVTQLAFETPAETLLEAALTATDADGDALTFAYSGAALPGLTFNTDGSFSYLPPAGVTGDQTFQFTVTDGFGDPVGPLTATISVGRISSAPPTITQVSAQTVKSGAALNLQIVATDDDIPYGDVLTFSLTGTTYGATITPDGQFSFSADWSPRDGNVYYFYVKVEDTDNPKNSDTMTFQVTVTPYALFMPMVTK